MKKRDLRVMEGESGEEDGGEKQGGRKRGW